MLVPREQLAEAEQIAAAAAEAFTPGDPFDAEPRGSARWSPTPSASACAATSSKGVEEGARLVTGGAEPPEGLERGYFVRPTVFSDVTPEMTIAQEEIFGPVLVDPCPTTTRTTRSGSPTTPTTGSPAASGPATRSAPNGVARRIRTGQVEINGGAFNPLAPFGGYKQSGHGRELGRFALEEFLQVKSLQL